MTSSMLVLLIYLVIGNIIAIIAIKTSNSSVKEIGLLATTILAVMWPVIIVLCIHYFFVYWLFSDDSRGE